jgi:hypothetical protein
MATPISELDLDELVDMYEYLRLLYKRKSLERMPGRSEWILRAFKLADMKTDMAKIFAAMETKIPNAHYFEIYKLEEEMKDQAERQRKKIEHIQRQNKREIRINLLWTAGLWLLLVATVFTLLYIGNDVNASLKSIVKNLFK